MSYSVLTVLVGTYFNSFLPGVRIPGLCGGPGKPADLFASCRRTEAARSAAARPTDMVRFGAALGDGHRGDSPHLAAKSWLLFAEIFFWLLCWNFRQIFSLFFSDLLRVWLLSNNSQLTASKTASSARLTAR